MQTNSKGGDVTEINSLTDTVARLAASVAWWNTALIVMMVVAALAATGLVVSQYVAFKKAEKLVEAQDQLSAAKDAQLARELKEKDEQIANANERAEAAKAEAAKANERILEMQKMRRLTKDQAEALRPLLTSEAFQKEPKPALRVAAVADAEAQMFATELQSFFASCGVNIYPTSGGNVNECVQLVPNENGLVLTVKSLEDLTGPYATLQHLMCAVGLKLFAEENPTYHNNEAMISVLRKPS
jgi:uncharacterized iron-regulated membrane protein